MRLTLIIFNLSNGGAERVMSILANYWAKKGWHITLLTFDDGRKDPFYNLHPAITHRPLGIAGDSSNVIQGLINNIKRIWVLRQAIKTSAPKTVISFMSATNVLVIWASLGLNLPVVISERNEPARRAISKIWGFLRRWSYAKSVCLIAQTERVSKYFLGIPNLQTRVIPNPVIFPNGFRSESKNKVPKRTTKILMAMGRLHKQKGFDLLLKAFAKVSPKYPDWNLVIWGEGKSRTSLESLRDQLGLQDRVQFPGITKQSYEEIKLADLFVLSSRWEGFPNVLCEAMACGLPVISFDCPCGPREIIREGIDGILVQPEDVGALAAALESLMENEEKRNRLAERAPEVIERFGLEKIMGMWNNLILNATKS